MKSFLLAFWLLCGPTKDDMAVLRKLLPEAATCETKAEHLNACLDSLRTDKAVITGYKGVVKILLCQYTRNPIKIWEHFSSGKTMLEKALEKEPGNVELHFLRFTVQTHVPQITCYTGQIESDKKMLLQYLTCANNDHADADLRTMITSYLLQSEYCNNYDKKMIQNTVN